MTAAAAAAPAAAASQGWAKRLVHMESNGKGEPAILSERPIVWIDWSSSFRGGERPPHRLSRAGEPGERLAGGFLFGGLLRRALSDTRFLAVDHRRGRERPVVRRPVHVEHGIGNRPAEPRECFLELGLVVDVGRERVLDPAGEGADDGVLDPLEAVLEKEG